MSEHCQFKDGKYYLYRNHKQIGEPSRELAIAFTEPLFKGDLYTLLQFGSPEKVEPWVNTAKQGFRAAGFSQMSDKIYCVKGCFSEEHINRLLDKQMTLKRFLDISGVDVKAAQVATEIQADFTDTFFAV